MRSVTDAELADLRQRMMARAEVANDPDSRDQAEALVAALDELAEHRRKRRSRIGDGGIWLRLEKAVERAGGQAAFRKLHPMSQGYLSDALRSRDDPGPKILDAIGVRRRVVYEVVGEEGKPL